MATEEKRAQTVLVVDDDAEWRDFLFRVIGGRYAVRYATSGEEALRAARASAPDIMLLDVMLPGGMDGFAAFCRLKDDPETRDIPVILLTGVHRAMNIELDRRQLDSYLGAAPAAILEKPVSPERLLEELERVLGRRGRGGGGTRSEE